ncbi:KH domain-containing protein [Sporolactobacillus sp. CPB3-1]|uniref:RNA-binding protein KhpA n=1 Tax=Sporolactobacillus mangiferae TaxID=2940498 RepID=A0ABT0M7P2_9BACL|nr:KH domain-containing protein [Sporolactobacillus mangiferae]MCL1630887.1 KH domain-containing protein [Sporolactobacillus mangiferae]
MEELIKAIVNPLIDDHEHVVIEHETEADQSIYVLTVNRKDMGKVIGRHGQVADAVRTIVEAVGNTRGVRAQFLVRE